ncbi:hypothetical protein J6590_034733 [Homalodisca vitripennis]|nr:hypothetical protein J6590_034733 [Homalodisca vitripennis]
MPVRDGQDHLCSVQSAVQGTRDRGSEGPGEATRCSPKARTSHECARFYCLLSRGCAGINKLSGSNNKVEGEGPTAARQAPWWPTRRRDISSTSNQRLRGNNKMQRGPRRGTWRGEGGPGERPGLSRLNILPEAWSPLLLLHEWKNGRESWCLRFVRDLRKGNTRVERSRFGRTRDLLWGLQDGVIRPTSMPRRPARAWARPLSARSPLVLRRVVRVRALGNFRQPRLRRPWCSRNFIYFARRRTTLRQRVEDFVRYQEEKCQ